MLKFKNFQIENPSARALFSFFARVPLQRKSCRFDSFFNKASASFAVLDRKLRFVKINEAFAHFGSGSAKDYLGQHFSTALPKMAAVVLPALEEALSDVSAKISVQIKGENLEGNLKNREWLFSVFPVEVLRGRVKTLGMLVVETTDQRRLEEAEQTNQRLKSIGTLAGGIAHDFNNILTVLFGNIEMAKVELPEDHPAAVELRGAKNALGRASGLTRQLLTFAKGGNPLKEVIQIDELLDETVRFDLSGSKVLAVFSNPDISVRVKADKGQIQQVFSNITTNARQAMPEGGRLHISLIQETLTDKFKGDLPPGDYVKITLSDEGSGIDRKNLGRVFEPYFTTKQAGHGLGLAITYSVIKKHGGDISVESELGIGTRFTIRLPALAEGAGEISAPIQTRKSEFSKKLKILLMDDEKDILDFSSAVLKKAGHKVQVATHGKQTIELYQEALNQNQAFDCVVMDLTISGGWGGKEAARQILKIHPEAACVVTSGYADDTVMANYLEYGFKNMLEKPFTGEELLACVAEINTR